MTETAACIVIASIALYRRHLVVRDGELELRKVRQLAREYQLEAAKDGGTTDGDALPMVHKRYREDIPEVQQAADSIERSYYSVELRAGRYAVAGDEKAAYRMFVNEVESLREEQGKRQQQLEQPVEVKQEQQA
ncbi:hypothetical protein [Kibdelosporangium aridum]|uniref:hypothetical protein n=1 Tax=Kibdelosporangium aridum TaxID=2030 RepID=UPI00069052A6